MHQDDERLSISRRDFLVVVGPGAIGVAATVDHCGYDAVDVRVREIPMLPSNALDGLAAAHADK